MSLHSLAFDHLERLRRHHDAPRSLGSISNTLTTTQRDYTVTTTLRDTRSFSSHKFSLEDLQIELKRDFHPHYPNAWIPLDADQLSAEIVRSQLPAITLHSARFSSEIPYEARATHTGDTIFDSQVAIVTKANSSTLHHIFQNHALRQAILDLFQARCKRIELFGHITPIRATFYSHNAIDLLKVDTHTQTVELLCSFANTLPHITVDPERGEDPYAPENDPSEAWNTPPSFSDTPSPKRRLTMVILAIFLIIVVGTAMILIV